MQQAICRLFCQIMLDFHFQFENQHTFLVRRCLHRGIMFTPARDFLLEAPWRIIIPIPNVNIIPFDLDNQKRCEPFILYISKA
jgi:hypothetical protein